MDVLFNFNPKSSYCDNSVIPLVIHHTISRLHVEQDFDEDCTNAFYIKREEKPLWNQNSINTFLHMVCSVHAEKTSQWKSRSVECCWVNTVNFVVHYRAYVLLCLLIKVVQLTNVLVTLQCVRIILAPNEVTQLLCVVIEKEGGLCLVKGTVPQFAYTNIENDCLLGSKAVQHSRNWRAGQCLPDYTAQDHRGRYLATRLRENLKSQVRKCFSTRGLRIHSVWCTILCVCVWGGGVMSYLHKHAIFS